MIQSRTPETATNPRIDRSGLPELLPTDRTSSAKSAVPPHREGREGRAEPRTGADPRRGEPRTGADPRSGEPRAPADGTTPADTERLGDEIARLASHLHAATYRMLVLIREFDAGEGWGGGFRSCAHWLSWRTGIGPGTAREKVRVAKALAALPRISGAMASGELSFSKVRAMTRVATPENERELLELARHATAAQIETIVRAWRRVGRLEDACVEAERHLRRSLDLYPDDDGSWVIRGRLDPDVGAVLRRALAWASDQLYRDAPEDERRETTVGQRRADAMGVLAEEAMATGSAGGVKDPAEDRVRAGAAASADATAASTDTTAASEAAAAPTKVRGRSADRYQVLLHVGSWEERAATAFPSPAAFHVSAETSRRLACDAGIVVISHDAKGAALDVGRKRRTVPPAMRRALEARDGGGCRFPGCGVRRTDAHHLTHWADGGRTRLENLVLLCRRHHRAVHEGGWSVRIEGSAEVETTHDDSGHPAGCAAPCRDDGDPVRWTPQRAVFRRPDRRRLPVVPRAPEVEADPVGALERTHGRRGIRPDAWTATSRWDGARLDLHRTILALQSHFGSPP